MIEEYVAMMVGYGFPEDLATDLITVWEENYPMEVDNPMLVAPETELIPY